MEYILTKHAKDMMIERNIKSEWLKDVISNPDFIEERIDGNKHYFKKIIDFGNRYLHIVINNTVEPSNVITLFFDRNVMR